MSKENLLMKRGQSLFPMKPFHPTVPQTGCTSAMKVENGKKLSLG